MVPRQMDARQAALCTRMALRYVHLVGSSSLQSLSDLCDVLAKKNLLKCNSKKSAININCLQTEEKLSYCLPLLGAPDTG